MKTTTTTKYPHDKYTGRILVEKTVTVESTGRGESAAWLLITAGLGALAAGLGVAAVVAASN